MDFKRILRTPMVWVVLIVGIGVLLISLQGAGGFTRIDTSAAEKLINDGKVQSAKLEVDKVDLTLKKGEAYTGGDGVKDATRVQAYYVEQRGASLVQALKTHLPPDGYTDEISGPNWFGSLLVTVIPLVLVLGLFWFLMSQMQGGGSKVMSFGKSKAKLATKDTPKVTFADVAGADEAVEELREIKEFLAEPAKFLAVGAKIPKGVLLYGQPGTGKTLLARAVAGEAGVPFYSISGSDFVEMFVGVGASRVRDLFEQAKNNAPAIVFVDEIDAVGRHRGAGLGGGHDEREQTLNQLLVEMDGFDVKTNVILIAATNRPDILDPALLRPGRFDRQIAVDAPDMIGRHRILEVHGKGKPLATDVDLLAVARRTPGFTGADLANVLNEAALLTARRDAKLIDDARAGRGDRPRRGRAAEAHPDHERQGEEDHRLPRGWARGRGRGDAAHRPGHQDHDPAARPGAGLHDGACRWTTSTPPPATRSSTSSPTPSAAASRRRWSSTTRPPVRPTTSRRPPALARKMVTQFGMSERIGAIKLGQEQGEVFLGRDMGHQRDYSEDVAGIVDEEVRRLHRVGPRRGLARLIDNRDVLDELVLELLEKETLEQGPARRDLRAGRQAAAAPGLAVQRPAPRRATSRPVADPRPSSAGRLAGANGNGHACRTRASTRRPR